MRIFLLCCLVFALLGLGADNRVSAQTPSWRGFVLIEFTPEFGSIEPQIAQNLREALSGLCPVVGNYPPMLLQVMVNSLKNAIIAECRWYAKPDRAEIARVLAYKFDASVVQADSWIASLTYFGEDQSFEISLQELKAFLIGKEEWRPPRPKPQ